MGLECVSRWCPAVGCIIVILVCALIDRHFSQPSDRVLEVLRDQSCL